MIEALPFEVAFWGDCLDTFYEERKHYVYARLMGLDFDLAGQDVLDIGGGPVSMLLKCRNRGLSCTVTDPILREVPQWVRDRYEHAGIGVLAVAGENYVLNIDRFDEVWIYNVLQHVVDPVEVIATARAAGRLVRIFEWIDMPAHEGHPHELTADLLDRCFQGSTRSTRRTYDLNSEGCYGRAFVGVYEQEDTA